LTDGSDLGVHLHRALEATGTSDRLYVATLGLALGPYLYDLWLIDNENTNEDILIDIFVGRHPADLRVLAGKYQQLHKSSLADRMVYLGKSRHLQMALRILAGFNRPEPIGRVDSSQVAKDVKDVQFLLTNSFAEPADLLRIFLTRSDAHIQQLAIHYNAQTGKELDKAVRTHVWLNSDVKKIVVHAIRTAMNMTYRDVMLLRDSLGSNSSFGIGNCEKLGIRVVRMHWYSQHWMQIKAGYRGLTGKDFVDVMRTKRSKEAEFGDLMVKLSMV